MTRRQQTGAAVAFSVLFPLVIAAAWFFLWPRYQLGMATKAAANNDLPRAEELLRGLAKENARDPHLLFLYSQVLRRLGKPEEALAMLRRAAKAGLTEEEGRREAALLEAREHFSRVEKILQELIREKPDDVEVLAALAFGHARSKDWPPADKIFSRLVELEPDRMDFRFQRGQVRREAKQYDLAAVDFREILKRDPDNFEARFNLAHCLLTDAKIPEAEAELVICRRQRPQLPGPLISLAVCRMESQDWDQAQKLLTLALNLDANSTWGLHQQSNLFLLRQRPDLAIGPLTKITRLQPRDKQAHLNLAQAYRLTGDDQKAKIHALRYQDLNKEELRQFEEKKRRGG